MKKIILLAALTLLLTFSARGIGAGKLEYVARFGSEGNQLNIATYTEDANKVGLIGITLAKKGSYAASRSEWDNFIKLWDTASQTNSTTTQFIGSIKETETTDPTLLLITAGPGVRITLETGNGSFSYLLPKSDYAKFEEGVRQVAKYLATN
ncbi:MAG TPA: hypothetical protein VIH72_11790 [Candidatus Acidoferrales bacterium]|jgi:hypothetical protein